METSKETLHTVDVTYLSKAERVSKWIIFVGSLKTFFHYLRISVWVLYAKTFPDITTARIGLTLYAAFSLTALSNLIVPTLSDVYGFDKCMTIGLVGSAIGIIIEAFSKPYFFLFAIGSCITGLFASNWALTFGFLTKMLSNFDESLKYHTSLIQSLSILCNLLPSIVAGLIETYISPYINTQYVLSFYVSIGMSCIAIFVAFTKIYNTQEKLLLLKDNNNSNDMNDDNNNNNNNNGSNVRNSSGGDDANSSSNNNNSNDNNNNNVNDNNPSILEWQVIESMIELMNAVSRKEKWLLVCLISLSSCVSGVYTILLVYIYLFTQDCFSSNYHDKMYLFTTLMVFLACLSGVVSTIMSQSIEIFFKEYLNASRIILILVSWAIEAILLICVFPLIPFSIYWIIIAIVGFLQGFKKMLIFWMIANIESSSSLENSSGKIAGFQRFSSNIGASFGVLIVGILWHLNYQWFWYVQGIISCIGVIITVIMCLIDELIHDYEPIVQDNENQRLNENKEQEMESVDQL